MGDVRLHPALSCFSFGHVGRSKREQSSLDQLLYRAVTRRVQSKWQCANFLHKLYSQGVCYQETFNRLIVSSSTEHPEEHPLNSKRHRKATPMAHQGSPRAPFLQLAPVWALERERPTASIG